MSNNIDNLNKLIQTALTRMDELTMLHLNLSKRIVDNNYDSIKSLISLDTSGDLLALLNKVSEKIIEINLNNCRDIFETFAQTRKTANKMFELIVSINKNLD